MRVFISFVFALAIPLSCTAITTPSFVKMLQCERYSATGIRDNLSQHEYDAKFPSKLIIDVDVFKAVSG